MNLFDRPQHPVMIVIAGPSGVGKDTIAQKLIASRPDSFYFVVTATTRLARVGEVDGEDYFFVTNDEFAHMIDTDELLEWAIVYNDFKGVPKQQIRDALASDKDVILRVDVQGAATIRKLIPNAVFVFLAAESEESLVQRLRDRRSETDSQLSLRIATARKEMNRVNEFDYYVINRQDEQERTVEVFRAIIDSERHRLGRQPIAI